MHLVDLVRCAPKWSFAALICFVVGSIFVVGGVFHDPVVVVRAQIGGLLWSTAYFIMVTDNYRKKQPIQTRGGTVVFESSPWLYRLNYAILYFIGLLVIIFILSATVLSNREAMP